MPVLLLPDPLPPWNTIWRRAAALLLSGAFLLSAAQPATAQFRDVAYTLEPTVSGVFESDDGAFQNAPLYGGALGLSFGRRLQVSGEYLFNTDTRSDFSQIEELSGLLNRDLDVRRYGGRLRLNLYDRSVLPYLTAGTGILQFDPDGADLSRTVYAIGGAGLTFEAQNRYRVSVGGEVLSYRYDPIRAFLGSNATDFEGGHRLVRSPSLTASLSLYLGGRSLSEQTIVDQRMQDQFGSGGLRGVQLFVQPFYGRVAFNEALGFPKDQNLTGVNAGLEFGPYVGLRGFYWRGTTGDDLFDDVGGGFEDMELYGSELRIRLNTELGRGFVPYATVGGGYLNLLGGYEDDIPEGAAVPKDRFFATGGGGLEVPLTRTIKASGGVRSLFSSNPDANGAGAPDQKIYGSLMYSAGLEFRIGGGRAPAPSPPSEPPPPVREPTATQPVPDTQRAPAAPPDRAAERLSRPARADTAAAERATLLARVDSLEQSLDRLRTEQPDRAPAPKSAERPSNVSDRAMTIPVPEVGEVYVRYGGDEAVPPSGQRDTTGTASATPADLERQIREALRDELQAQTPSDTSSLSGAEIERIIRRVLRDVEEGESTGATRELDLQQREEQQRQIQRMEEELADLRRQLRRQSEEGLRTRREAADRPSPPPPTQTRSGEVTDDTDSVPFYRQTLGRPLTYVVPVTGFRVGEGPDQLQIGVRGDYRMDPESRLHLLPELAIGLGGRTTGSLLFNGAYTFLEDQTLRWTNAPLEPYAGIGLGLLSNGGLAFEIVGNLMLGTSYRFRNGQTGFIELSTLDLFDTNRIAVGYRFPL